MTRREDHVTRRPGPEHRLEGEDGSVLVMALAFLSLFGLAIAALLGFADTSFRTTIAVRERSAGLYAADGAVEAAINAWREPSSGVGSSAGACGSFSPPVVNDVATRVECTAYAPEVVAGGTAVSSANKPRTALLTTSTNAGEDGLLQGSNSGLHIKGHVYSNSTVRNTASSAQLLVDGPLTAEGGCSGNIESTPDPQCDAAPSSLGDDPGYDPAVTTVPPYRTLPSCTAGPVVSFLPGYYDDAVGLTSMMSGSGPCAGKVFWFRPNPSGGVGVYYFDFHGTSRVWTVDDSNAVLIGGTPKGWSPSDPSPSVPVPGGCYSPLDVAKDGVQFMFGNDSRLAVRAGKVEVCAQPSATTVPVALYGIKSGAEATTGPVTSKATAATSGTATHFADPAKAIERDDVLTIADLTTGSPAASLHLTGFTLPASIPSGSVLNAATLRVAHRYSRASLSATITPAGGSAVTVTVPTPGNDNRANPVHDDAVDVKAALAPGTKANGLSSLSVKLDATRTGGGTAAGFSDIDAVRLELTYTPPALQSQRKPGSCTGTAPYQPAGSAGCAFVTTDGAQTELYVQGTFYAPYAALDVNLTNVSGQVFRWGLVARSVRLSITPSSSFLEPTIQIPDDTGTPARRLILTAYVCPGAASCPAGSGTPQVRAEVKFNDASPGHAPTVRSWSVLP